MGTANSKPTGENETNETNGTGNESTPAANGTNTITEPKVEKTDEKTVTIDGVTYVVQDHVNELVGNARTEGKNAGKTEAQKAAEKAAEVARESALKDQGQYKDLYEAEQAKVTDLQTQLTAKDTEIQKGVRSGIAAKYGLSDIEDRIVGGTAEEMETDAKLLAERMGIKKAVSTQTGEGSKPAPTKPDDSTDDSETETKASSTPSRPYAFQAPGEVKW